jgi:hypothetical protein
MRLICIAEGSRQASATQAQGQEVKAMTACPNLSMRGLPLLALNLAGKLVVFASTATNPAISKADTLVE